MIRSLKLKNFQAWADVTLPLAPITVIIGETNAGKSSLLRALASVLFNAFEGQGMVRQGSALAEVELELEEGSVIRWARGAGVNRYMLDDQLLDKPGRAVPPAVQDVLQIRELEFDGEVVRLQWAPQMDAPFLLADSGAKATRMLGVAGNAAVVAQAVRLSQQEVRQHQDDARAADTQVAQLTRHLESFTDVSVAEPIAEALRQALSAYEQVQKQTQVLAELAVAQEALGPARMALTTRHAQAMELQYVTRRRTVVLETYGWMSDGYQVQAQQQADQARLTLASQLRDAWAQVLRVEDLRAVLTESAAIQESLSAARSRMTHAQEAVSGHRASYDALVADLTCPACGRVKEAA